MEDKFGEGKRCYDLDRVFAKTEASLRSARHKRIHVRNPYHPGQGLRGLPGHEFSEYPSGPFLLSQNGGNYAIMYKSKVNRYV